MIQENGIKKINTIAIIQARLTSKRFPNKVLEKVKGQTLIQILINRIKFCKKIDKIIVAIPKNKKQKKLKKHLRDIGANYFEGSEQNVLDRYYQAAKKLHPENVVRITADCPLIDYSIIDKLVKIVRQKKYDYASNVNPATFPDGLDVSVIKFKTLEESWKKVKSSYDKEHVVTYIQKNKNLKKFNLINKINYSSERWTVDEKEDFEVIKKIIENFNNLKFSWRSVIKLKKKNPQIFFNNSHLIRDEGLLKKLPTGQIFEKTKIIGGICLSKDHNSFYLTSTNIF